MRGGQYMDVECSDAEAESLVARSGLPARCVVRVAAVFGVTAAVSATVCGALLARRMTGGQPANTLNAVQLALAPGAEAALPQAEPLHLWHSDSCEPNEELYAGLCYKKCALLTDGEAPIRTSSWTCCPQHPCSPVNEQGKAGLTIMCTGFDIGGDGLCPHEPGACLDDEELHSGLCFKRCGMLTEGTLPFRSGPSTCCKMHGLNCLSPEYGTTKPEYAVGGGFEGSKPHRPQLRPAGASPPAPPETAQVYSGVVPERSALEIEAATTMVPAKDGAQTPLEPKELMHDGNVCDDQEELYGGLCYARCSVLTHGHASIRTSSWTCCTAHPCYPWNQFGSVGTSLLCNGYDVSADGSCPHKPGACLMDEELYMGMCYKKCGLLTDGAFPHRFAPTTCCKTSGFGCLNIGNVETSRLFAVGGGAGDNDPSTPAHPHFPLTRLTEDEKGTSDANRGANFDVLKRRRLLRAP